MSTAQRKVTVNLPTDVLEAAMKITGKGLTPTLVDGLIELERSAKRAGLRALRGKVRIDLDLDASRR